MDKRTDGQPDAYTIAKTSEALHAVARKNKVSDQWTNRTSSLVIDAYVRVVT